MYRWSSLHEAALFASSMFSIILDPISSRRQVLKIHQPLIDPSASTFREDRPEQRVVVNS